MFFGLHFNSLKSSLVSRLCDYVTCDFCMLLYADDNAMGHVMYVFALQRLVQGHGALKAGSIDVSTLDKDIATLLDQTVHVSQEIQPIELPDLAEPCWSLLCKEDPAYNLLKRMVQNFWNVIQSKRVKPGCLLLISTSIHGVPDTAYYLGTMLKRPLLQTLIEATVNDQEAEYRMLPSGMPHILTANELFLTLLRSSDDMSQVQVKVEVWKCQCFLQDRCHLKANPSDCIVTFELTTARPALKPAIHVPGILKKLRKRTKKRQPRRPRKVSAKAAAEAAAKAKAMAVAGHVFSCMSDSDIEGGVGEGSQSGEDDMASDAEARGSASEDEGAETVLPASDTIANEEKLARSVAREVGESDQMREDLRATAAKKAVQEKSYFSKTLGLSEAGLASSGRAICLACKQAIPKSSVRFAWYYSRVKPYGWVHAYCLVGYVQAASEKDDSIHGTTVQKLLAWRRDMRATQGAASSSSTPKAPHLEVLRWIEKILEALRKE